jgi:hypothetical protein
VHVDTLSGSIESLSPMKDTYSWRRKAVIPMFDEKEWTPIARELGARTRALRNHQLKTRRSNDFKREEAQIRVAWFKQLTGLDVVSADHIIHHRRLYYGPDCPSCQKPLRTDRATFCAECGYVV